MFFLAVDNQRLVQAVANKYKDVGIDGADYLEKIVQMPFQMPRLSPSAFKDYLSRLPLRPQGHGRGARHWAQADLRAVRGS